MSKPDTEKKKYYVYSILKGIYIVWLTDDEYLKFIRKHWSDTVVLAR